MDYFTTFFHHSLLLLVDRLSLQSLVNFAQVVALSQQHTSDSKFFFYSAEREREEEEDGRDCAFSDRDLRIDAVVTRFLSSFRHPPVSPSFLYQICDPP